MADLLDALSQVFTQETFPPGWVATYECESAHTWAVLGPGRIAPVEANRYVGADALVTFPWVERFRSADIEVLGVKLIEVAGVPLTLVSDTSDAWHHVGRVTRGREVEGFAYIEGEGEKFYLVGHGVGRLCACGTSKMAMGLVHPDLVFGFQLAGPWPTRFEREFELR